MKIDLGNTAQSIYHKQLPVLPDFASDSFSIIVGPTDGRQRHFLVVTPPHLRTSYNHIFFEDGCIWSRKRMVVSLSSL